MVGRTLSHYRIVEELGAGGMGVVYRADDVRLGRPVALKFLPESLAHDRPALDRFQREARAASALNHPNICTIHDIDEDEGRPFIVMEFLDGETLRAHAAKGRMSVPAIVDLGIQLAAALEAAHAKGVVHRDIKPENVFCTSRGVGKLLDFGIAKLVTEQAAATAAVTVTRGGTGPVALGTVAYMSPEQARGEPLDARTDLFSLGVVLYELSTGVQPFRGSTSGAIVGEILTKAPAAPIRLNPEVPAELERMVNKLLEKDRELRYQSASDLRVDLERLRRTAITRVTTGQPIGEEASIVVLPFDNLSPDPDNAFFADGLTEEIITDLSKVGALRVISRNSAMQLKKRAKDTRTIGLELNVRYVLEGSVRRAGQALRVTAQLVDASTDRQLWAEKFNGSLEDVFAIQEKLSRAIVDALKVKLSPREESQLAARPIGNIQAYECYLRARQELYRFTDEALNRALQLSWQATSLVGDNELIQATIGQAYLLYLVWGIKTDERYLDQAEECARKAFALNPDSGPGHALRGMIAYKRGDRLESARLLKRALEIWPANPDALIWLVSLYARAGKAAPMRHWLTKLLEVDPLTALVQAWVGLLAYLEEGPSAAGRLLQATRKMYEMDPYNPYSRINLAWSLLICKERHEALQMLELLIKDTPAHGFGQVALFWKGALGGDPDGARSALSPQLVDWASGDDWCSWFLAEGFAAMGANGEALDWLENAVRRGLLNYPLLAAHDPLLEPIRAELRFKALLGAVRPQWEALA